MKLTLPSFSWATRDEGERMNQFLVYVSKGISSMRFRQR
jgi:hypothetical protein